jgi:predicted benzoate:H+ symporter BenE
MIQALAALALFVSLHVVLYHALSQRLRPSRQPALVRR